MMSIHILSDLHKIVEQTRYRRDKKWSSSLLRTNPDNATIEQLYCNCINQLYTWLDELTNDITKKDIIIPQLHNICSLKKALDTPAWTPPANLNTYQHNWFVHDLYFYLMLSSLLHKICTLFEGFCNHADYPSSSLLKPNLKIGQHKLRTIIQPLSLKSPWLIQVIDFFEQTHFGKTLKQIVKILDDTDSNSPEYFLLIHIINKLDEPVANRKEEQYQLILLDNLLFKLNNTTCSQWQTLRSVIKTCLLTGSYNTFESPTYFELFQALHENDPMDYEEEIHYWQLIIKEAKQNIPPRSSFRTPVLIILRQLIHALKQKKNKIISGKQNPNPTFIEWNHYPQAFVELIHPHIFNGHLQLNGSNDMEPIVNSICKFVKVKKKNKKGNLSPSSLLSYFKKANSGDL
ncbi:hypothetical protein DMA11_22415 [Marinilabiliaceae bacterium JC017]|nr:hypothetical protein DMA11_22415 [Marinilabiliaceae bacterium JC017]